jgi:hypothetical protein
MTVIGKINGILASIKWALTEKCNRTACHGVGVVAVAFQMTEKCKIHANYDFLFFKKIIFDISTSKRSKTYKIY